MALGTEILNDVTKFFIPKLYRYLMAKRIGSKGETKLVMQVWDTRARHTPCRTLSLQTGDRHCKQNTMCTMRMPELESTMSKVCHSMCVCVRRLQGTPHDVHLLQ